MFHLLFKKVNKFYEKLFRKYGRFLSKYYKFTICISFLVNLVLSFGIFRINMITDTDVLFMPIESEAKLDEKHVKYLFNSSAKLSADFYLHQILDFGTWAEINFQPCKSDNILSEKYMTEIARISRDFVESLTVNFNNSIIKFEDVCARRNGHCLIDGIDLVDQEFYNDWLKNAMFRNERLYEEKQHIEAISKDSEQMSIQDSNEFRFYIKSANGKVGFTDLTYNLGKDFRINTYNESNNRTIPGFSRGLKLRYNLKSDFENADLLVKQWEYKFIETIDKHAKSLLKESQDLEDQCSSGQLLKLSYGTSQSLDLEMAANIVVDTSLIVGTFLLIMTFAAILMSINSNCITSPGYLLPLAGIASAMFGISSSFGLLALLGYPGCNLIFVIPFLVIGIGIDDMFIIYSSYLHSLKGIKSRNDLKTNKAICSELISTTLSRAGVSITITSLTDFVAFLVGLTTGFKSVQIFCVYAGFAIAFCYFYQLLFFSGFLCIHTIRVLKKNNTFLFCYSQNKLQSLGLCKHLTCCSDRTDLEFEIPHSNELVQLNGEEENNKYHINRNNRKNSKLEKASNFVIFKKIKQLWLDIFKFLICTKRGKFITGVLYVIYLSLSLWSAAQIREGINLADLVAQDSYYSHYIRDNTKLTDLNPIVMFVVSEPINYDSLQNRIKLKNLMNDAFKIEGISKKFNLNWLGNFGNKKINYKKDINNLIKVIKDYPPFMNDLIINKLERDVKTNKTIKSLYKHVPGVEQEVVAHNVEYEIAASRFYVQYDRLYFSSLDAKPMHLLRRLCKESGLPIVPYSITFKFYEQFEQTLPNILQSFLIAVEAMYFISLIFIPDLVSVCSIVFSMGSIMIGLLGWMHIWGLTLSSVTMIELIMSVGFCIDFSAHITHAFITNGKGDRNKRAYKSFLHVGVPIFNSALSTVVGISLLAFCKSYIFISFFKTMLILMCLGVVNSLLFLPVLLSLIGPNWPMHKEVDEQTQMNDFINKKPSVDEKNKADLNSNNNISEIIIN